MSLILEEIKSIIAGQLEIKRETISENSNIFNDLGADSLDVIELVSLLEEQFDIQIPEEESNKITTVGDVVNYVEEKKKNK
jgi:acyl carrier protein